MIRILTILSILLIGQSCSLLKGPFSYEICIQMPADTSDIVKNEIIGIADTIVASLSGHVTKKKTNEPLPFSNVILTDKNSNKTYGIATDMNGKYSIIIPAGEYNLGINYIGYSDLLFDLTLGTGEMREINVAIGHGISFVTYAIESDKRLNKKQLNIKAEQLRQEKKETTTR